MADKRLKTGDDARNKKGKGKSRDGAKVKCKVLTVTQQSSHNGSPLSARPYIVRVPIDRTRTNPSRRPRAKTQRRVHLTIHDRRRQRRPSAARRWTEHHPPEETEPQRLRPSAERQDKMRRHHKRTKTALQRQRSGKRRRVTSLRGPPKNFADLASTSPAMKEQWRRRPPSYLKGWRAPPL